MFSLQRPQKGILYPNNTSHVFIEINTISFQSVFELPLHVMKELCADIPKAMRDNRYFFRKRKCTERLPYYYRLHPKDGEGNVFSLFVHRRVWQGSCSHFARKKIIKLWEKSTFLRKKALFSIDFT